MTERKLKEYFENKLSALELATDLKDSQRKASYDVTSVYVDQIKEEGEFEIKKDHLVKLCDDVLSGHILPLDLNTISFALMTSRYFNWDKNTKDTELIENVIDDSDSEPGYNLTIKNVELWKNTYKRGMKDKL
jgi:hypothetical protein